jgi:hypothetical protein
MITVIIDPKTNQQFEVRMGLQARPKDGFGPDVQVLSFNERDSEVNIEELYSEGQRGFPRKMKMAVTEFSRQYRPLDYAF